MIKRHNAFPFLSLITLFSTLFLLTNHTAQAKSMIYGMNDINHIKPHASAPFYIQIGAFKNKQNAQRLLHQHAYAYPVKIENHRALYLVIMGPIPSYQALQQLRMHPMRHQVAAPHRLAKMRHAPTSARFTKEPMDLLLQKNKIVHKQTVTLPPGYHTTTRHTFRDHNNPTAIRAGFLDAERTDTPATPYRDRPLLLNFSVGIGAPSYANTLTISNGSDFPAPYNLDSFSTKTNTQALLSVGIGKRYKPDVAYIKSLTFGARYQYLIPENIGNNLTQYSSPEFLNYNYHWSMTAQILTGEAKLNLIREARLSPYINGGLGVSFNQAKGYMETALPLVTERYSPSFNAKSVAQFTWHAGVGLDYDLGRDWIASIGYDFESLGAFASGSGVATWGGESLQLGNVNTNMAMLGITYLMG
ncbi:MAG: SPOR domain-containing protein [Gammaproteobacteria bacterium]|nr:SPOR domain-containing protein [Gammaproteobacteria bacterium]